MFITMGVHCWLKDSRIGQVLPTKINFAKTIFGLIFYAEPIPIAQFSVGGDYPTWLTRKRRYEKWLKTKGKE